MFILHAHENAGGDGERLDHSIGSLPSQPSVSLLVGLLKVHQSLDAPLPDS
jgi:hypothetical protein